MSGKNHLAAPSATGYLYQCRYALHAAISAMNEAPNLDISIEKFDDVAFEKDGDPIRLIQTKHHIQGRGSLSDTSIDLWNTLRIWLEIVDQDPSAPLRLRFILLTTGQAPLGSAAGYLRGRDRNETVANSLLLKIATGGSTNVVNEPAYRLFQSLPEFTRLEFLKAVLVLDGSSNILDIRDEICGLLKFAVPRGKLDLLVERLEGWWFALIIRTISSSGSQVIPVAAIENKIDELREAFLREALPVDFADKDMPSTLVAELDKRPFVKQLRHINVGDRRIEFAMRDFYRASEQRSKWAREDLLVDGEVEGYQRKLVEAWEPHFEKEKESLDAGCPPILRIAAGQRVYEWAENNADFPFRSVRERFLTHGSFHILANQGTVGWHPDFRLHFNHTTSDGVGG